MANNSATENTPRTAVTTLTSHGKSAQSVRCKGQQETGRHQLVYCPGTSRSASSFFFLTIRIVLAQHITAQKHVFQNNQHVSRHLHLATMISEVQRGFNFTLTKDNLAMNLGFLIKKPKNVPRAFPLSTPVPATKTRTRTTPPTTTRPDSASGITPFPPFEPPETTTYELFAESDYRVATLVSVAQVASLTRKDVGSDEFGCYPCLCDSSRCICICISPLVSLHSCSYTLTDCIKLHSRPPHRIRRRTTQPQTQSRSS